MYKHFTANKKAIVFDLDGTVADTEPFWAIAFKNILLTVNEDLSLAGTYGLTGEPVYEKWARLKGHKVINTPLTIKELTEHTQAEFIKLITDAEITPREGFWNFMYALRNRNFKIGLATNTEKKIAEIEIKKLELDNVFDFTIYGDEVKHKKPDPEIYKTCAKSLGVKTSEMLIFEDSVTGAKAAAKSGASLIVIWEGAPPKKDYPKQTLTFLSSFIGLAENMDLDMESAFNKYKQEVLKIPPVEQPKTK